jgi:hypothetical protein
MVEETTHVGHIATVECSGHNLLSISAQVFRQLIEDYGRTGDLARIRGFAIFDFECATLLFHGGLFLSVGGLSLANWLGLDIGVWVGLRGYWGGFDRRYTADGG